MSLFLLAFLALAAPSRAADDRRFFKLAGEIEIDALIKEDAAGGAGDLKSRVARVSERFLGTPYKLEALGEGPAGEFDREPVMSFKAADCTTYVEHVMALSLSPDLASAKAALQRIRYKDGVVRYESRNHFPEIDWIPNNVAAGFIRDVTREVAGAKTKTVERTISKARWYSEKQEKDLSPGFEKESPAERADRVLRWRELGKGYADERASLDYLPIEALPELLEKIPSGTILNLVREPSPKEAYPILVTHQTLLVDTPRGKRLRHAAFGRTVEEVEPLAYFYKFFNAKWPLLGLNLNEIRRP